MERDCESELSKLNIEQNACIYHFGASVIHGQRSNILRLHCNWTVNSKDTEKNKIMKINEQWEELREKSHANIQSERGILKRQTR